MAEMDKPEIGVLWINKYYDGKPSVISGNINGEKVLILVNRIKKKQAAGAPDYKVFSCDKNKGDNEYNEDTNPEVSDEEFDF